MTQPATTEQLLILADRAERGPLTAAEASRLREGINELHAHLNDAAGDRDSWARDARQAEHERDRYCAAWHNACRRAATLRHVARSNLRHVQAIVPDLEAATQRAERAEAEIVKARKLIENFRGMTAMHWATLGRVRALAERWAVLRAYGSAATELRAALDEHQEQPATVERQPATEQLVHIGWWCWRGDNHGHLVTSPCRSDNVPLHAPTEWADDMRAVIQRIEDGDDEEEQP